MPAYETPGVYYERVDASAPGIAPIRTDIIGFVGIARRGPLHAAVPVQSWRQFQSYFGDVTGAGYLAYAVRGFFENGGRRCWVVRVASDMAAVAGTILKNTAKQPAWRVEAFSPGVFGNDLDITIQETHRAQTLTYPNRSLPEYSVVASVTGFVRGTHARLSQGTTTDWKIVSDADAGDRNPEGEARLIWLNPDQEKRQHVWKDEKTKNWHDYQDSPLTGFDPGRPILIESVEYTVLVRDLGRLIRVYEALSLVPDHQRYGPRVLAGVVPPRETDLLRTLPAAPEPLVITELRDLDPMPANWLTPLQVDAESPIALKEGADGLALLSVRDFIGEAVSPLDSDEVKTCKQRGLRVLDDIREVAILAVPDIHIQPVTIPGKAPLPLCVPDPCLTSDPLPAIPRAPSVGDLPPRFTEGEIFLVQAAMVEQCELRRDRIALLDPPFTVARDDSLGTGAVRAWRRRFDSKYAAFYFPWLKVVDPLRRASAITRDIPPSGHVAGQYAHTDWNVGVHKAPANDPLAWVQDVTIAVDDAVHGFLNPAGINAIRTLPGRGIRIFGARTVSNDPDWRFVNVRRLLMMIEKAIDLSIQWAVFEPNNHFTRAKLSLALTSFLLSLWQKGALMGGSAAAAFFVRCDEENNPEAERGNGRLLAEVGVAPSQPFEFVVLRIGRTNNQFEISEATDALFSGGPL